MNARILLIGAALAGSSMVMAQENRFSLGVELAVPMGDFGDAYSFGIGGTLGYELPISDNIGLMAQVGYISFMGKKIEGTDEKLDAQGMIPLQVGAKYYFSDNQEGAYFGVLTGVHMQSMKVPDGLNGDTKTETNTNFSLAPELGFIVGENLDLALRYQMIFGKDAADETTTTSYLGLRVAYMFGER